MYRIRTYNNIAQAGLAIFPPERYEVGPEVESPDGILLRSHSLHDEPVPDNLVAVARAGAGVNNIPVENLTRRGVVVLNTPGGNANAVKELVAAALFLSSRDIVGGSNFVQALSGVTDEAMFEERVEKEKKRFKGTEISGKKLGVVGLGAIGSMVANLALELGMKVAGYDPAISVEAAWRLSSQVHKMDSIEELVSKVDFLTIHVPLNDKTLHLVDRDLLSRFKPGARLLNFARQGVIDIHAVVEALESGALAGYVTDFPSKELIGRPNVLLLPHIGASTREAEENCAVMAATQMVDFLESGNVTNSVNFPRTRMDRNGGYRITFSNQNVPAVLGSVLAVLAERKINIIDMVNKSQGEAAYNIIDVEVEPSENVIREIASAKGVIRVRVV